jgi:hypothetical protein
MKAKKREGLKASQDNTAAKVAANASLLQQSISIEFSDAASLQNPDLSG